MQPFSLDSTNLSPQHWLVLARVLRENYDCYDGFVISHGTDTMAYTAAALSYRSPYFHASVECFLNYEAANETTGACN